MDCIGVEGSKIPGNAVLGLRVVTQVVVLVSSLELRLYGWLSSRTFP